MTETSSELDPARAVTIGRIAAAHGVRGEVRVEPLTDFPERYRKGAHIWLDNGESLCVEAARWQGRSVYLKLEGIEDRDAAEGLRGKELRVPEPKAIDEEDVYYQHDVVGLRVETQAGEAVGRVDSIFSTGANDVYVVHGDAGELLLPAVEDVIKQVDIAARRMVVEVLPGLEFTKKPTRTQGSRRPRGSNSAPRPAHP